MKKDKRIDAKLIEAYQSGNTEAFAKLVKRWHLTFCKKAFWIVKDADLAKDIAQETWQVVIKNLTNLKEPHKFGSWALRIVCNKSIDILNSKNRERIDLKQFQNEQHDVNLPYHENQDLKTQLGFAIKGLPKNQQLVLNMFYLESYSLKQIAEILNISAGTAKSRLFYAREKLKSLLKHINYEN